ncbi:hypothetical protein SAMN05444392_102285 [Seinonella peptonophila]|uniref:Uncharacterized protein n=1 Tax=Seinonella peptonophila TaxID=112248 RepID=A0A1M4VC33_9BACL|nr:hypothetical protein [Seinonella peptonophila]SHE66486.1 hypothetical protein SAMN05444392_102285 [Seinonella peptonophila]
MAFDFVVETKALVLEDDQEISLAPVQYEVPNSDEANARRFAMVRYFNFDFNPTRNQILKRLETTVISATPTETTPELHHKVTLSFETVDQTVFIKEYTRKVMLGDTESTSIYHVLTDLFTFHTTPLLSYSFVQIDSVEEVYI